VVGHAGTCRNVSTAAGVCPRRWCSPSADPDYENATYTLLLRPLVDAKWFDALLLLVGIAVTITAGS